MPTDLPARQPSARLAQLSPEMTGRMMGMVNRMLPPPREQRSAPVRGMSVRNMELVPAKKLGWSAARRYNEVGALNKKS